MPKHKEIILNATWHTRSYAFAPCKKTKRIKMTEDKEITLKLTSEEARLLAYQLGFDGDAYVKQDQPDYSEFLWRVSRCISDQLKKKAP